MQDHCYTRREMAAPSVCSLFASDIRGDVIRPMLVDCDLAVIRRSLLRMSDICFLCLFFVFVTTSFTAEMYSLRNDWTQFQVLK